ncbi:hypothetical protein PV05_03932 [Exophiala xenobiotica]|uniref:JmjC domain-containing histone demethylation protein 1 n=1 Tax=Exophiala xenobiotica TaxID=348802 RepID=A0A0D2EXP3_9EURO|nr:uncharacterized protein PV05_03932 [Exophiala xenobiotica]KIW59485.1 hypothetical protein PV05_03932 [Exophiala xenobiotica]
MPTSTVWRLSEDPQRPRGVSPIRPQADSIERLSPEPILPPSTVAEPSTLPQTSYENGYSLSGLGLSDAGISDNTGTTLQPDHLYYDQDGAAHVGARVVGGATTHNSLPSQDLPDWLSRNPKLIQETRNSRAKGHTRSGSTIDDLASAAIATSPGTVNAASPSFSVRSPYSATRPSTSYIQRYSYEELSSGPPAKRIKSERIPNLEWSPRPNRPKTSGYETPEDITHEDAWLLLSLKNEVNFKRKTPSLQPATLHKQAYSPPPSRQTLGDWNIQETPAAQAQPYQSPERELIDSALAPNKETTKAVDADPGHISMPGTDNLPVQPPDFSKQGTASTEATDGTLPQNPDTQLALGPTSPSTVLNQKQKRIRPEKQQDTCAGCHRLQPEATNEEDIEITWIQCGPCELWFHEKCAGFRTKAEARGVDKYICKDCEPSHGKTTYVRKSSRQRTAVDYVNLNQGVVKSSDDTHTHHYIQPIKEGKIAILTDDFARIRPELLTVEFMESVDGMKRPFVVPSCWNPRFGANRPRSPKPESETATSVLINGEGDSVVREMTPTLEPADEEVIDCDQDLLDMVIPRHLTVRKVAELYGPHEHVPVIDVKTQETKGQWTLGEWADYYEKQGEKPIRNVISLEVSHSPLGKLLRRPRVVRELDLEDTVWHVDPETRAKKRPVQFYCLMSVADSYTDFHIDFGGSSVYYHILKGTKTFFFIPPEDKYLKKYEEWCNSDSQNETWLGDLCGGNVTRVDLHEGDTAFIPAGWIHSVWTPEDSLVIGGNFLTRIDYETQLKVFNVEKATKVAAKFRYPFFQKVMWYALMKYLDEDPVPEEVVEDFREDPDHTFLRANPVWHEIGHLENTAEPGHPAYNSRYYPKAEVSGWPSLRDYLYRTARVHAGLPVADINKKQIEAVKNSIPKECSEPLVMIKLFAIWIAWKTGNVAAPEWVHSDGPLEVEQIEKIRKPDNYRLPGERTSARKAAQAQAQAQSPPPAISVVVPAKQTAKLGSKGNGSKSACESCRKRRIKCKHKSGSETPTRPAPEIRPRSFSNGALPVKGGLLNGNVEQYPALDTPGNGSDPNDPQSSKKGRTKACEECRKSKRRCVHDEYGRVDPAKAAEPSKPRGSSSSKRPSRPSDENGPNKRAKTSDDALDDLIDPALTNGDTAVFGAEAVEESFHTPGPFMDNDHDDSEDAIPMLNGRTDPQLTDDDGPDTPPVDPAFTAIAVETAETVDIKMEHDQADTIVVGGDVTESVASRHDSAFATPVPIKNGSSVNGDHSAIATSTPGSRQSSRQHKQVERYTPEDKRSPSKTYPKPPRSDRRGSSAASAQTAMMSEKSRRSSSHTSSTLHQMARVGMLAGHSASIEASARPNSSGSTAESDVDADERFARDLQAAENGLRRRTSMRA